jgi:Glyoxalase-like domain
MSRAIDHIVIPAHDLGAQAELYARLGFQVGPRNRHPWGTENHIVQFDGAFLELISLGEGFVSPERAPKEFSFAGFVERYLSSREGLAMVVMQSSNAEADRAEFARLAIGDFSRFDFARQAQRPDGAPVKVAFSLAFAASPAWDQTGFFVCQQHFPENFWSRSAQFHPNGALGIAALRFEHPRPEEGREFLRLFLDAEIEPERDGYAFDLEGARVEVRRGSGAPALSGLVINVEDLTTCRRALQAGGISYEERAEALVVPAEGGMGAVLSFVEA